MTMLSESRWKASAPLEIEQERFGVAPQWKSEEPTQENKP